MIHLTPTNWMLEIVSRYFHYPVKIHYLIHCQNMKVKCSTTHVNSIFINNIRFILFLFYTFIIDVQEIKCNKDKFLHGHAPSIGEVFHCVCLYDVLLQTWLHQFYVCGSKHPRHRIWYSHQYKMKIALYNIMQIPILNTNMIQNIITNYIFSA